jgi:hypothetical protein
MSLFVRENAMKINRYKLDFSILVIEAARATALHRSLTTSAT